MGSAGSRFAIQAASSEHVEAVDALARLVDLQVSANDELARPHARLWVSLAQDGDLAGFLLVWVVAGEAEVLDIAVSPAYRRQGVAKELLNHLQVHAKVERVFLEVSKNNEPARALYETCGFEMVGERKGYYRDGSDALLLSRVLVS